MKYIIGVDIGATDTKFGCFTSCGKLKKKWSMPTDLRNSGSQIIEQVGNSIQKELSEFEADRKAIISIGIGIPGPVDIKSGEVINAVNLGWGNYNVGREIEKNLNVPVNVGNDANLAALGEYYWGAGKNAKDLAMFTIGSGIGGAIILNGSLLNGSSSSAGEFGHIKVDSNNRTQCNCGSIGCLETTASANGLVKTIKEKISSQKTHVLNDLVRDNLELKAEDIINLAKKSDELCLKYVEKMCLEIAIGISNVCCVFNPDTIVIGGGVANAGGFILEKISEAFIKQCFPSMRDTKIVLAELGNDAGIYGAMSLAHNGLKKL